MIAYTSLSIGTSSIVDEKTHEPLLSVLSVIVETAVQLHKDGHRVVIVSSGAIAIGLRRMEVEKRPKHLPATQVPSIKLLGNSEDSLVVGTSCRRAMSTYELVRQPFRASTATRCTNIVDKE